MRIENEIKLDYSDVLICPKRSESPSRKNVSLHQKFRFLNSGADWEGVPIVAANMSTVGTFAMAKALAEYDMPVCLHSDRQWGGQDSNILLRWKHLYRIRR